MRRSGHPEAVNGFVVFTAYPILKMPPYEEVDQPVHHAASGGGDENDWGGNFPTLYRLFAGFLFEAWPRFYASSSEAIQDGISHRTEEALGTAIAELDQLMSMGLNDRELDDVLFYGLGSHHTASHATNVEWLSEVRSQLQEALDHRISRGMAPRPLMARLRTEKG